MVGAQKIDTKLRSWDETTNVNEIFTPSDEAFCLLVLENYNEYWSAEREYLDKHPGEKFQPASLDELKKICPKYNQKAEYITTKKGDEAKFKLVPIKTKGGGGWLPAGIKRYNDILNRIEKKREENGDKFNKLFGKFLYKYSNKSMGIDDQDRHVRCRKRTTTIPLKEQPPTEKPKYRLPTSGNSVQV